MKKISGALFIIFFLFFLFTLKVFAQIPTTAPIPCLDRRNPEFNSDRPYQASPCGEASTAMFCGDDLVVTDKPIAVPTNRCRVTDDQYICNVDIKRSLNIAVKLSNSSLPIMGNTELVKNSQTPNESLDDAEKVNQYVSWYLNGVTDKAEYGPTDLSKIVDYSGPVKKLFPQAYLDLQRIQTIKKADAYPNTENHNQIVVCRSSTSGGLLGALIDIFRLGKYSPVPCYVGNGSQASNEVRIAEWDGTLSFGNLLGNAYIKAAVAALKLIYPWIPDETIIKSLGNHWNKRIPPLPWDNDPFDKTRRMTGIEYQKYYNEWKGRTCFIVPVIDYLICFNNLLIPSQYADLFQYVPLGNTTDKEGQVTVKSVGVSGNSIKIDETINPPKIEVKSPAKLYFAHNADIKDISQVLSKYFSPAPNGSKSKGTNDVEQNDCKTTDVRSNPGDNLFPGELKVKVDYTIAEIDCPFVRENPLVYCEATPSVRLKLVTTTPDVDEPWNNLVAGPTSVFRKIYPKVENGAPVSCIADIPAVSPVDYTGDVKQSSNLYFPHIGSISEYFLKGIQTALRPKGYGDGQPISGQDCKNITCFEFPKLPPAQGSCNLGGTSSRLGEVPQSLKDILSAAAETYKVPPNLILGIMYGEGAFNPGRYSWTEENVKNWASCQKLPNCTGPESSIVNLAGAGWDQLAKQILPDLKKIDSNKSSADPCNLLDAIFALAKNLHNNAGGSSALTGRQCLNVTMSSSYPTSCDWSDSQYETSIRVWEFGTKWGGTPNGYLTCATKAGSCFSGGGVNAQCPTDVPGRTDSCDNSTQANSHNKCVWNIGHGI